MAKLEQQRNAGEEEIWRLFMSGAYQAVGCCKNPTCESHQVLITAGRSPSARVCLTCFEFEFDCRFPTRAALARRKR